MTIDAQVIELLAECAGISAKAVKPTDTLSDLDFDSFDRYELMMEVEDRFSIHVDDKAVEKVKTVADVVALVKRSQGGGVTTKE